jgi:hypothetical protein
MRLKVIESPVLPPAETTDAATLECCLPRKRSMSWMATTLVLANVGLVLLLVGAVSWFGSVTAAVAYLQGESLIPDARVKSFGVASLNDRPTVNFSLKNRAKRPIKIVGTASSCSCLITSTFPIVIEPWGEAVLSVRVGAKRKVGPFSERLRLITDTGVSNVSLTVRGVLR